MNRLERLLDLVAALLETERPLRRDEIMEKVPGYEGTPESARRAFERDKDALREMGIPLLTEPIEPSLPERGEGYRIRREQYELPDPGLVADELAALHLAATTVRLEDVGSSSEAIWKLGGAPVTAGERATLAALPGSGQLPVLFAAVSERRVVRLTHRGAERTVDPWRLSFRNGFWYLAGYDHDRAAERSFRLDRVEHVEVVGEAAAFAAPSGRAAEVRPPWEMGEEEPIEAEVAVDADQAPWAEAKAGSDAVARREPDGAIVLRLRVTNRDALRSFVLGFLDRAELLRPPDLRADLVHRLEELAR